MKWNKVLFCIGCGVLAAAGVPAAAQAREVTVPIFHVHDGSSEADGECYEPVYRKEWEQVSGPHGEPFDAQGKCFCGNSGIPGELCKTWVTTTRQKNVLDHYEVSCTRNVSSAEALLKLEQSSEAWSREIELRASCQVLSKDFVSAALPYIWNGEAPSAQAVYPVSQNGTYTLRLAGEYSRSPAELTGHNIDRTAPVLEQYTLSTEEWTKEPVRITVTAVDLQEDGSAGCGLAERAFAWNNESRWEMGSYTATENEDIVLYIRDKLDNVSRESIAVRNIDRTSPTIKSVEVTADSDGKGSLLTVAAEDKQNDGSDGCGLAEQPYSWDNGRTWQADNTWRAAKNGVYQVKVRDRLGNESTAEAVVNGIDAAGPAVLYENRPSGWTNEDVTIIVSVSKETEDKEAGITLAENAFSWDDGQTWSNINFYTVKSNTTKTVWVRDKYGNITKQKIKVTNIDKNAPDVTMQSAQKEWITGETKEIALTTEASDDGSGLAYLPFSWDGGKTWGTESNMSAKAAGTYQVVVKDKAGNVASCTLNLPEKEKKDDTDETDKKDDTDEQDGTDKKDDADKKDNTGKKGGTSGKGNTADDTGSQEAGGSQKPQDTDNEENDGTLSGNEENSENKEQQGTATDKKSVKKAIRRTAEAQNDEIRQTLYQKTQEGKERQNAGEGETAFLSAQNAGENTSQKVGQTEDDGEAAMDDAFSGKEPQKGGPVDWKLAVAEAAEWFLWVLAILALLCLFVLLMWFFFTSAEVYTKDRKGKEKLLGRCMVYKKKDGYMVRLGQSMYEKSETGEFIIAFQSIFADMAKGSPLLVKSGDRTVKAVVREETRLQI